MAINFYFDTVCSDIYNFDCGHQVFNDYLLHDDDISVIHYVLDTNSDELLAYFALTTSALLIGDPSDMNGSPAIELKMFALDKKYRGLGIAQSLLEKIIDLIIHYSSYHIGAEAIILYSVPVDYILKLYEQNGFERIDSSLKTFRSAFTEGCIPMVREL